MYTDGKISEKLAMQIQNFKKLLKTFSHMLVVTTRHKINFNGSLKYMQLAPVLLDIECIFRKISTKVSAVSKQISVYKKKHYLLLLVRI